MTGTNLIATMASRYEMDPVLFAKTIRATVMPSEHTDEQFRAFMMIAYQYGLNPITREIYAYPARKGGGINPVVSIDGWINLVNSHPQSDGFQVTFVEGKEGKPVSATCQMWRKDRSHPTIVTEYYAECYRNTDPWNQMAHRMLRHKAFKEAARLAFGFAGITDEDEARDATRRPENRPSDETIKVLTTDERLDAFTAEAEDAIVEDSAPPAPPSGAVSGEEGSSEGSPPVAAADPAPSRTAAIAAVLEIAGQTSVPLEKRLEKLEDKGLAYADQYPVAFVRDLMQISIRVAKNELSLERGQKFLEQLP